MKESEKMKKFKENEKEKVAQGRIADPQGLVFLNDNPSRQLIHFQDRQICWADGYKCTNG